MKNKNELKETDIKNCVRYYFDDIINGTKITFWNILLNKKLYENISVYNISYKSPTVPKPLPIRFSKIYGFIKSIDDKIKHQVLFNYGLLEIICDKIKYLASKKSVITNSINYNFGKIKIDSCNSLPIKKILTFHNLKILIKSVVNKNENNYYYNMFLEKGSCICKSYKKYF